MASLLAHFDWTKEPENFTEEDLHQILHLTQDYRQELEFKRHMAQLPR